MDEIITITTIWFGLFTFVCFLLFHVFLWRIVSARLKGIQLLVAVAFFSYLFVSIVQRYFFDNLIVLHYSSLPLFLLLMMLYLHLYVGVDRSVSIRILGELCNAPGGRLSVEELRNHYPGLRMVQHRLELMCGGKWLLEKDGRFFCAKKADLLARFVGALRKIYRIDITG